MSYDEVKRVTEEEFVRAAEAVRIRHAPFKIPELSLPTLDQTDWYDRFFPDGKQHGSIFFFPDRTEIVVNTWMFLWLLMKVGEARTRDRLLAFFVHELIHLLFPHWRELDVNIEEERILKEMR